jgi:basic membrane protein A
MKFKYFKMILAMVILAFLVACGNNGNEEQAEDVNVPAEDVNLPAEDEAVEAEVNIALIAHSPDSILDDGSFNQGAWNGIQQFISTYNLSASNANFFQPHEASDDARIDLITDAISSGANILILPGFHFENALYEAQDLFPETTFVLLDASPAIGEGEDRVVRIADNVAAIHYAEEQAGFLAGYAAVLEGYRELGYMGGTAVPAVVRFGHGFIQGAEYAAAALELEQGEVTINYMYLGGFAPDPAHTTTAASWYAAGTEVIFVAAGGAGGSVMSAAESANASVIGVDVDQSHLSDSVISSAVKGLDVSVYDMLTDFMNGEFNGGSELRFDASINGVNLPMDTSRFTNFTQAQYETIFEALKNEEINVISSTDIEDIPISFVTLNEL